MDAVSTLGKETIDEVAQAANFSSVEVAQLAVFFRFEIELPDSTKEDDKDGKEVLPASKLDASLDEMCFPDADPARPGQVHLMHTIMKQLSVYSSSAIGELKSDPSNPEPSMTAAARGRWRLYYNPEGSSGAYVARTLRMVQRRLCSTAINQQYDSKEFQRRTTIFKGVYRTWTKPIPKRDNRKPSASSYSSHESVSYESHDVTTN